MQKVIHLVPYDGIGGVEAAARSMETVRCDELDFEVRFIFHGVDSRKRRRVTFNPFYIFQSARRIASESPEVLIVSLWRAAIVGLLVKFLNRRIKLVVFIHNSVDAHFLDFLFTRWSIGHCAEVWADSAASVALRFRRHIPKPVRTISFLVHRILASPSANLSPVFAFWGRLSPQKDVGRALRIFHQIHSLAPEARFFVIGPDCGELDSLLDLSRDLNIADAVSFLGPMDFEDICIRAREASFYLQTSRYEGMAMSVVEAMQMGLVPIVTPVGEIANYCRHGENALLVTGDVDIPALVLELMAHESRYRDLGRNAIATWEEQPLYADSILAATQQLLAGLRNRGGAG